MKSRSQLFVLSLLSGTSTEMIADICHRGLLAWSDWLSWGEFENHVTDGGGDFDLKLWKLDTIHEIASVLLINEAQRFFHQAT